MVPVTPYSPHLEERDPLVVMRETIPAFAAVLSGLSAEAWERPIAPGKWSVRKVMIHLAQTELALGTRARMALTREHYAAQSFDQDRWLALESGMRCWTSWLVTTAEIRSSRPPLPWSAGPPRRA